LRLMVVLQLMVNLDQLTVSLSSFFFWEKIQANPPKKKKKNTKKLA
jgi:hypothetical protein